MSDKTSRSEEEIDLGQLFTLIGRGSSKLGGFVGNLFQFMFSIILAVIFFIKKHIVKLVAAGLLGLLIGLVFELTGDVRYEASMVVKPNYESGRQLYKNIAYYDELVRQENIELLSSTFNISKQEAESIKSFEIEPITNENFVLSKYDDFVASLDSTISLNLEYDEYKNEFPEYSFFQHKIIVVSTANDVFLKLENSIVSGIVDNPYFKGLKESKKDLLERNENYLNTSLVDVDTLREVYKEVMLAEARKVSSQGTNINMTSTNESSKELDLFTEEVRINNEIDAISIDRIHNSEILNVISSFQPIGFISKGFAKRPIVLWSFGSEVFLLLILLVIELNHFLNRKMNN